MKDNIRQTGKTDKMSVKKSLSVRQLNFKRDSDKQLYRKFSDFKYVMYQSTILKVIDRREESINSRMRRLKLKRDKVIRLNQTQVVHDINEKLYRLLNEKLLLNVQFNYFYLKDQLVS